MKDIEYKIKKYLAKNIISNSANHNKKLNHYLQKGGYTDNIDSILEYMRTITTNGIVNKEAVILYGTSGSGKGKILNYYKTIDPNVSRYINLNLDDHVYNSDSYKLQIQNNNITTLKQIIVDLKKKHGVTEIKYTFKGRNWTEKLDILDQILSKNLGGVQLTSNEVMIVRYFLIYLLNFEKLLYDRFMTSTNALYFANRNISELINETLLNLALYFGNGIIFETTGGNYATLSATLQKIIAKGYNIVLLYPFVSDIEILHRRVLERGIIEGRFLTFDKLATIHAQSIGNYNTYIKQFLQTNIKNIKRIIIGDNSSPVLRILYDCPTNNITDLPTLL